MIAATTPRLDVPRVDEHDLTASFNQIVNRWPAVGFALGVVRNGRLEFFKAHGLADIAAQRQVTEDTVFRIASITKTFTAIAVMQLWERGLVDLDAPANDYLRGFKLVPAKASFRPVTPRHLLTHTAGIREALHPADVLRMRDMGDTVSAGRPVPSLAEYYGGGLRFDAEPGTRFMYTNHGFGALRQIVEDVSGQPLDRYFREHIFDPLGMVDTDLVRSDRLTPRLAIGYELRSDGAKAIEDYETITVGGGGALSTPRDIARYLAALMGGGANEHGSVLEPATLRTMFAPHYQPDPRIPGMGLGFWRADIGGYPAVEHGGILPGFDSEVLLAPDRGVGVMAFANGARRGFLWLTPAVARVLRQVLGVAEDIIRIDVPQHPEVWTELCGRYRLSSHPTDPARLMMPAGAEVRVRDGRLIARALSPIPALNRGLPLHPDDARDPYVFRLDLGELGIGTGRLVFSRRPGGGVTAAHLDFAPLSFEKRPARKSRKPWVAAVLGVAAFGAAGAALRRARSRT